MELKTHCSCKCCDGAGCTLQYVGNILEKENQKYCGPHGKHHYNYDYDDNYCRIYFPSQCKNAEKVKIKFHPDFYRTVITIIIALSIGLGFVLLLLLWSLYWKRKDLDKTGLEEESRAEKEKYYRDFKTLIWGFLICSPVMIIGLLSLFYVYYYTDVFK